MQTSQRGVDLIKTFEGCELRAYRDAVNILTIGYGHTGPDVREGLRITLDRAEEILRADLHRFEDGVKKYAGNCTQSQFDALVSFSFNVGLTNLANSTLLRKHKAGDFRGAAAEFLRWDKARGKRLAGLSRRRAAESALYAS